MSPSHAVLGGPANFYFLKSGSFYSLELLLERAIYFRDFISDSSGIIGGGLSKSMSSGLEIRMEVTTKHSREVVMGIHGSRSGFPLKIGGSYWVNKILSLS